MSTASIQVVVQYADGKVTDTLEVKPGAGSRGQTVRIQVQEGVRYQLKDLGLAGQKGPEVVKLKRVGKNLFVNFEEGQSTADLVLENYYSEAFTQPASLVGESQNNRL